jgi:UPF0755 protein
VDRPAADHRRARVFRRRRWVTALVALALVLMVVLIVGVIWYKGQENPGPEGPAVVVDIPSGASVGSVTQTLAQKDVIGSTLAFRINLLFNGTPTVRPGRYLLHRHEDFGTVRQVLAGGPDVFALSVPAGFTVAEVARQIGTFPGHSAAHFLATARSGSVASPWLAPRAGVPYNLDGLLGTGNYLVLPGESDSAVLRSMVDRFNGLARSVGLTARSTAQGLTPYEAITEASIVQKEAFSPGDSATATAYNAPRVARVIDNRLEQGTPLQVDSTVLYAEGRDGGPVTSADLAVNSPYNTYEHTGLTPSPICFPSRLALEATLRPASGRWLFFVLTARDGTETFSDTFAGQQAAEHLAATRGLP